MPIDALTIIFRFTIFGLLAYKVTQLINTYAIPFLKEVLSTEHKNQTELFEKEKLLVSTQHRLETQISSQKKSFSFLEKNASLWQAHLLNLKNEAERTTKLVALHLEDKRKIQQEYLALAKNVAEIIPIACEQATLELAKSYDGENGKKQLHTFINNLILTNNKIS